MTAPVPGQQLWDPQPGPPRGHLPSSSSDRPAGRRPLFPALAPPRPRYRESRPVRWWSVLVGMGVSLVYYVLVGLVAWSVTSFVLLLVAALLLAVAAIGVLLTQGDRGIAVGVTAASGAALSVIVTIVAWGVFDLGERLVF